MNDVGFRKHYKMTGEASQTQAVASGKGVQKAKGPSGSERSMNHIKVPEVRSNGLSK